MSVPRTETAGDPAVAPRLEVLRAANLHAVPWKNGGGKTTEIAARPRGTSLDAFDWRVSMARVVSDGPFSAFPGIDRTLTVVSGCGLSLRTAGRDATTVSVGTAPFAFSGDTPTEARLTNGPISDLNVMTRRRLYRHALLPITRRAEHRLPDDLSAAVLISLDGSTHLHGLASGCPVRLDHGDAAVIEVVAATVRVAPGPGALAWLVLLCRVGSQAGCR